MLLATLLFCTSQTLFRSPGPINVAVIDDGTLYVSLFGDRTIQRVVDGAASPFFTMEAVSLGWTVAGGTIILQASPTELLLVAPDGGRRTIAEPFPIRGYRAHEGFVYWLVDDGRLCRAPLPGGAIETIATGFPDPYFIVGEGRVVFAGPDGIFWLPLAGGAPRLLFPRTDAGINGLTPDGVLVSTHTPFDPNVSSAQVLRVPWSGEPVETIYETTVHGYAPEVRAGAVQAGATTYVFLTLTSHFFWTSSTLFSLRDGVLRARLGAPNAPMRLLAADEEAITIGRWVDAGGMRRIERVCATPPKSRAAGR